MKTIADTLKVSRSNLHERKNATKPRKPHYACVGDAEAVEAIRPFVDKKPSFGYRRITGILNKQRRLEGKPTINHKRVYRIMAMNGWLLEKHTANLPGHVHDGKVIVMRSDLRWCSDGFEIPCWNKDVVRVAFVIDAFDREVISWVATINDGIDGSMVRDMMLEAVEKRFGHLEAPHKIEFLSDNGSCYTAKETRDFAAALNLRSCFTPVRSPQSNGMSESFVKTFKRDFARINPLPDGKTVYQSLHGWFEEYNENHPHSGLKWTSPRDFRRAQS